MAKRKIHQIWCQGEEHFKETQPVYYSYIQLWKDYFPDYEYKLWSEEDYLDLIEEYSPELLAIYNTAPSYSSKSDIARHVILYTQEGYNLYVDTDYEPFTRFDYLINDDNIELGIVAMNLCNSKLYLASYKYSTAWIYAKGGSCYIKAMLDRIVAHPYTPKKYSNYSYAWDITGPNGFGAVLSKFDLLSDKATRIFSHSVIEVGDFSRTAITTASKEEILKKYPFAVGVHRMNASWVAGASNLKRLGKIYSFYNEWDDFIIILFIVISLLLVVVVIFMYCYINKLNGLLAICKNSANVTTTARC